MKKKLLVFTSTFPRWKNDTIPPFVYELSKRLTDDFNVSVLAPMFPGAKNKEIMDFMKIYRFNYFTRKGETLAGSGGILPTLKKDKLNYLKIPFFLAGEYFALRNAVRNIRPDIIHAHWIIPQGFICALVKIELGYEYVVTTHGGDIFGLRGKIYTAIKKFTLKNAKRITAVSNAIKNEILLNIDSKLMIEVIPMGVDSKLFNPDKKDVSIRDQYSIKGPFLLFVGRLAEKKGVKYLLDAMPEILTKFPKTKLMIIGTGTLDSELKQQTKKLHIERNVIFIGAVQNKELPKYYATADIFVGPSIETASGDKEGLPVTLVEAMFSGCIVITTDLDGNKDIIKNEKNGLLVKQKNAKDLTQKILAVIKKDVKIHTPRIYKFDWLNIRNRFLKVLK